MTIISFTAFTIMDTIALNLSLSPNLSSSVATTSLLIAIRIGNNSLENVKKYPLTSYEKNLIKDSGYPQLEDINDLTSEIYNDIQEFLNQDI